MINQKWHDYLQMPKRSAAWHRQDLSRELQEYRSSTSLINKWSEASDVVYTCTRGRWSGHTVDFPLSRSAYALGYIYMYPKYTLRFWFFRTAGKQANAAVIVREVRNPQKIRKLHHIAEKYQLDPQEFQRICERQLKRRLLLP